MHKRTARRCWAAGLILATAWEVRAINHGEADYNIRPWVSCAVIAE